MITRIPRANTEDKYNLKVTDKNGNSFIMLVGGNLDLYWVPENGEENRTFEIDKDDKFLFGILSQLYDAISKNDDKYRPVLKGNTITFVSEEGIEKESNTLSIIRQDDAFTINFIKNENQLSWWLGNNNYSVCFCNNGSRVPSVEILFMKMFNHLAYNCHDIETIDETMM